MSKREKLKILGCEISNKMLTYCIQCLKKLQLKIFEQFGTSLIDNPDKYESLLPNEKADTDLQYSKMLQIALETPKNNNIAVTGTHGSGKSSFLRTFESKNKDWEYLHISLATFQDIEEEVSNIEAEKSTKVEENQLIQIASNEVQIKPTKDDKQKNEKLNQILEKSILQQIFYKEKDKTIPFSRFKRIGNIKKSSLILHSLFIGMLVIYSLTIFIPEKVHQFLMCDLKKQILEYSFVSWVMLFILGFYFYKIFQYFMKLQVSKFNIKSGEIEVNNKDKTSILNEHLDEILYFFEVTAYNVVVIEDLDRFGNTEIFIKLRELNTLINNSKNINRRVVFVYAIKDDMFKDKDRTKFFDFIIPIIPYINSSNSFQKIKDKFEHENIDIEFLRNLSLRIDDMRLLINIANEYKIYKHKIGSKTLSKERLLAMIVYKNFYPSDFAELHNNKGNVYDIFNQRTKYISEELEKNKQSQIDKNKEISELENKIELEKQKSITELRMIYILKIFETVNQTSFIANGTTHTFSNIAIICQDGIFEQIINVGVFTNLNGYHTYKFSQVEKAVNPDFTYKEREKLIAEYPNKQFEQLKKDLESLKKKEIEIKKYNVSQISKLENNNIFKNIEKEKLLQFLIREGYIRNDYYDYISYFFPGSLTLKDRDFVLSVKDDKPLEFEYTLTNIEEIIKNLTYKEFEVKAILNYALLDYMLDNNYNDDKFNHFVDNLTDNSDKSNEFVLSYISITNEENSSKFIKKISGKWKNIFQHIYKKSNNTEASIDKYFKILFNALEVEELSRLNIEDSLKKFLESKTVLNNYTELDNIKFQNLIQKLNVKYFHLDSTVINIPLLNFIYQNNLYEINEKMISGLVNAYKMCDKSYVNNNFKIKNFTTITECFSLLEIQKYIRENINEYIENVFLKIETNTKELEETIIELLNNENLKQENKIAIIHKEETKISDISKVSEDEYIWKELLSANKIEPLWDNLLYYYEPKNKIDNTLLDFINNQGNASRLAKQEIPADGNFSQGLIEQFSRDILKEENLTNEIYKEIIGSISHEPFADLDVNDLSDIKIDYIIEARKIKLTQNTINSCRKKGKFLKLIENFKREFIEEINDFEIESSDYLQIFESSYFSNDEKISIIEKMNLELFDNENLVKNSIDIYIESPEKISIELFNKLFDSASHEDALKILAAQIPYLEDNEISAYLKKFDSPYKDLADKSRSPLELENNEINQDLLRSLWNKGYIRTFPIKGKKIKVNRRRK